MAADISVEILSENAALRIYDMVWTGTNYIAVGGTSGAEVWTSTDGISWTSRTVPTSSYNLLRVAYGNGIAAALSDDMLIYSTDRGTTWTKQTSYVSPYAMSPSIAFWSKTNTFYILVFGTLYKTTDFSSLTACLNTSNGYPHTIITSDSALWALADHTNYPSIYTSSDGINFSDLGTFAYSIYVWKGICIDESYLCFSDPTDTNTIVFVYNLTTHTSSSAGAFRKSCAIAYDGFQPVIVGVYYSAAESGIYDWNTSAGTFDVIENSAGKTYYTILYREDLDIFIAAGDGIVSKLTRQSAAISRIEISPKTKYMKPGMSEQFIVTAIRVNGTTKDITSQSTFASSNTGVAPISSAGLAKAVAVGMTQITATYEGMTDTALIVVQNVLPSSSGEIVAFAANSGAYRSMEYKTKRYKFKPASLSCIKVIADQYPVEVDVVYPSLKRAQSISVTSSKAQRIKSALVDCCEIVIRGNSQVSAVFLASSMDELPL